MNNFLSQNIIVEKRVTNIYCNIYNTSVTDCHRITYRKNRAAENGYFFFPREYIHLKLPFLFLLFPNGSAHKTSLFERQKHSSLGNTVRARDGLD